VTPEARRRLALIADVLIPPGESMPSATQVGVHEQGIDKVLQFRPDLAALVDRVTAAELEGPEAARAVVDELLREDRPAFGELLEAVAGAYFLDEDVSRELDYRRREELPIVFDDDLEDLTAPVIARGPAYRSVDGV
jgi:hypothetical protein